MSNTIIPDGEDYELNVFYSDDEEEGGEMDTVMVDANETNEVEVEEEQKTGKKTKSKSPASRKVDSSKPSIFSHYIHHLTTKKEKKKTAFLQSSSQIVDETQLIQSQVASRVKFQHNIILWMTSARGYVPIPSHVLSVETDVRERWQSFLTRPKAEMIQECLKNNIDLLSLSAHEKNTLTFTKDHFTTLWIKEEAYDHIPNLLSESNSDAILHCTHNPLREQLAITHQSVLNPKKVDVVDWFKRTEELKDVGSVFYISVTTSPQDVEAPIQSAMIDEAKKFKIIHSLTSPIHFEYLPCRFFLFHLPQTHAIPKHTPRSADQVISEFKESQHRPLDEDDIVTRYYGWKKDQIVLVDSYMSNLKVHSTLCQVQKLKFSSLVKSITKQKKMNTQETSDE